MTLRDVTSRQVKIKSQKKMTFQIHFKSIYRAIKKHFLRNLNFPNFTKNYYFRFYVSSSKLTIIKMISGKKTKNFLFSLIFILEKKRSGRIQLT